jgi:hypothetical protein
MSIEIYTPAPARDEEIEKIILETLPVTYSLSFREMFEEVQLGLEKRGETYYLPVTHIAMLLKEQGLIQVDVEKKLITAAPFTGN